MNEKGRRDQDIMEGKLTYGQNHQLNQLINRANRVGDTATADGLEQIRQNIKGGKSTFADHLDMYGQTYESIEVQEQFQQQKSGAGWIDRLKKAWNGNE